MQEITEHPVLISRVDHEGGVPVPEQGGVRVPDAELIILRRGMGQRDQGKGQQEQSRDQEGQAGPRPPAGQEAEPGRDQQHSSRREQIRRLRPEGNAGKGSQKADGAEQPGGSQPGEGADRRGKPGQGKGQQCGPVQPDEPRGEEQHGNIHQKPQQGQLLEGVQLRQKDAGLGAEARGQGASQPAAPSPPGGDQGGKKGRDQGQAQHRPEGQLEGEAGQLHRGKRQLKNPGGAEQMQQAPGPGQHPPPLIQKQQQGGPEHGLGAAAEEHIGAQQQGIAAQADSLGEAQQAEHQRQKADQKTGMKAADGKNMRDAEPGEGRPVLPGKEAAGAQEHGRGIAAGLLPERGGQERRGQAAAHRGGRPRQGKKGGRRAGQIPEAVEPDDRAPAEQLLPKIIAVRIGGPGGMIQPGLKGNLNSRLQPGGDLLLIEGPVSAAGQGLPVQQDMGQPGPDLTAVPELHLVADDAGNRVFSFRRKGGMPGEPAPETAQGQRQGEHRQKTPAAAEKQAGAQRGQAAGRSPDPGGSGAAQQKPGREADRQGRQEPAPLPGRHSVRSAPASATETSRKTARASRSSSPGAWAG